VEALPHAQLEVEVCIANADSLGGIVIRTVYQEAPPKVDYRLTDWGEQLCPALDALLKWAELGDVYNVGGAG
jgi:hypothetical protein